MFHQVVRRPCAKASRSACEHSERALPAMPANERCVRNATLPTQRPSRSQDGRWS